GLPAEHGFPDTLIYVVWAFTMIPPALVALGRAEQPDREPERQRTAIAPHTPAGAGGQMLLFRAVESGPPYLVFPIVSLSPALTIA
ncbi:EamA family transporter, partial [Burkholderia cenocepacia]|nr:EamA family transporter [Burkholderia cenocepacia]